MGRSRHDHALWARIARRGGTDPAAEEPTYLQVDPTSGALVVTGAGAAATATGLRVVGSTTPGEASVGADGALLVRETGETGLTDAQLRASAVPVATGLAQPLTDGQLRAAPVPVAGPLTDAQARATPLPVSTGLAQPLTDAQARATPLPVATPAGLATDAALVPLLDGVEALLTTLRDSVYRRTDPLPAGTNVIGAVIDRLETRTLLVMPSTVYTAGGVSASLDTSDLSRAAVDVNVTAVAGVAPELRVFLDRLGADGVWYPIWSPPARTTVGSLSTTVGQGMAVGQSLAASCRFRWEVTGTTPSFTYSASIVAK